MASKRGTSVKAARVANTYGQTVAAWRAGAVNDFYYGTRADDDPTLIWIVDGVEYAKTDHAAVQAAVASKLTDAGITSVEVGPAWCGYPSLTVQHTNGVVTVESYDGQHKTVSTTATLTEVAA